MKAWNLNAAGAHLELAMQDLLKAVAEAGGVWNDETYRRFCEAYIAPLQPTMRDTLESLLRLEQTLQEADRECGQHE